MSTRKLVIDLYLEGDPEDLDAFMYRVHDLLAEGWDVHPDVDITAFEVIDEGPVEV